MNDMTNDIDSGFSLADLADIDVSDIEEVRFVDIPMGIYDWNVRETNMVEDSKDGERRFKVEFGLEIIEVKSILEPGKNPDDFLKKTHTERFMIYPGKSEEDVKKAIGRVRAFITDIGLDSAGKLGAIVEAAKGHAFTGKITKQKPKDDPSHPGYARLRLEQGLNK